MKKSNKNKKHISNVFVRNSLIVLSILILIFVFIVTVVIVAFETGMLLTKGPHPHTQLGQYLLFILAIFAVVFFVIYFRDKKIIKIMQTLEKATEEVSKGNFKVQLELTADENINSYIMDFNKMVNELDHMETLQEDFISNVSHEFKTPLAVIQSYSKALRRNNLDEATRKQYEEVLDSNIKKLTTLTNSILTLAKLENKEITPEKSEFLIDEQLRQCVVNFQPQWSKKQIDFDLNLPRVAYVGNEELIYQIWQNIIGNAIKFSNANGKIAVTLQDLDDHIDITIADNGIGMDNKTQQKIFDKFYQADTSHSSEGNGLGLTLVSRILKIFNGKINVTSELNKGTTFVVSLPKTDQNSN